MKKSDRLPPKCAKLKESFRANLDRLGVKYRDGKNKKKKPPNPLVPPASPTKHIRRPSGGVGRVMDLNQCFDLNMAAPE